MDSDDLQKEAKLVTMCLKGATVVLLQPNLALKFSIILA